MYASWKKRYTGFQGQFTCGMIAAALPASVGLAIAVRYAAGAWFPGILACGLTMLLIGSVAWILASRTVDTVTELTLATRRIAEGRLDLLVGPETGDELSQLRSAFNEMTSHLRHVYKSVEHKVETRVRQLRQRNVELEQSCEAAEQARAFKDEFLANMSHEIRTPLTAIIGYAELLVDMGTMPEPERVKSLQNIQYNGQHLLNVINDVLDVAKLDANKMEAEHVQFAPVQLLNDVMTLMRPKALEKGLKLNIEFATSLPDLIETDPTRLRQIVLNLLGNAIKFTHTGSVRLVVKLIKSDDAQESFIQFDVVDTGIGIDAENLEKLFQPFTQGSASRTREYGGSGLGLVISQRLARLLGGDITVQSQFGEGSTFSVAVRLGALSGARLTNPSLLPSDSVAAYSFIEDEHPLELRGVRVLLADDTSQNRELVGKMLSASGAQVMLAENGRIACHLAMDEFQNKKPVHVILMDIQMPELNGYEATRKLRTLGYPGAIIALTASAMESDRRECIEAGCNDFARKPIERKKLIELVARWAKASGAPLTVRHSAHAA